MFAVVFSAVVLAPPSEPPADDAYALETVVRSSRKQEKLADSPFAITVLGEDEISDGRPGQSLGEALNQVPGVLATSQFNASQDLRISVRGFGARAPFGVRGVRVYLDGVPLTVPDGTSALDVIDPALIGRIEVLRGPAAALYGPAASAVILIETGHERAQRPLHLEASGGMNGSLRGAALHQGSGEGGAWTLGLSSREWLGERDQSASRSTTAVSRLSLEFGSRSSLSLTVLGHDGPRARDPGGLTEAQVETNPRAAAPPNQRFRTGEQVRQGQAGLAYRYEGELFYALAEAHGWTRQFRARVPFRAVELERWVSGARVVLGGDFGSWRIETGLERQAQRDRRRNFVNDDGRVTDETLLRQDENLTTAAWTSQLEWRSHDRDLRARAAGRVDRFSYRLRDRLLEDGDGSGALGFTVPTGLVGLVYRPSAQLDLFANSALAYDVPTLGELSESTNAFAGPASGLSDELGESQIWSNEAGLRGHLGPVRFDAAVFYAQSREEITAEELAPGVSVFRNSGRSQRAGFEARAVTDWRGFELTLQASTLWSELEETGRPIPGTSAWLGYGQLLYRATSGFFAAYELRPRGPVELGPLASEAAWVSHLRAGLRLARTHETLRITAGIRNLTDAEYSDNFRPNAFGERFFEPAPGRWFYIGVELDVGDS